MNPGFGENRGDASPIRFHSEQIRASFLSPDGLEMTKSLEVRFDPLLGTTSRIAEGVVLSKADAGALAALQNSELELPVLPRSNPPSHSQSVVAN